MQVLYSSEVINDFFSLHITHAIATTYIHMQVLSPIVNTVFLPKTYDILDKSLPSIHSSQCFNDKKLPFNTEVKQTEIGHLFEHILLEYIYEIKTNVGEKCISVKGETSWDWYKNPTGFFTITINVGMNEKKIFSQALTPAIHLLQFIFESHLKHSLGVKSFSTSKENFTPNPLPISSTKS